MNPLTLWNTEKGTLPLCVLEGTSLCEEFQESHETWEEKKITQEVLSIPFNNKIYNRADSNNYLWLYHLLKSQAFSHCLDDFAEISKY